MIKFSIALCIHKMNIYTYDHDNNDWYNECPNEAIFVRQPTAVQK